MTSSGDLEIATLEDGAASFPVGTCPGATSLTRPTISILTEGRGNAAFFVFGGCVHTRVQAVDILNSLHFPKTGACIARRHRRVALRDGCSAHPDAPSATRSTGMAEQAPHCACSTKTRDCPVKPGNDGWRVLAPYSITGIEKSAPSFTPLGQRAVIVLVRV